MLARGRRQSFYAPTWRDDKKSSSGHYAQTLYLDYGQFDRKYGKNVVILQRGHVNTVFARTGNYPANVVDVNLYPRHQWIFIWPLIFLLLTTRLRCLITLYWQAHNLPGADLSRYRDVTQGFYFDFERIAPGPIVSTTQKVIDAIESVAEVQHEYSQNYERFLVKFAPLDDGFAGELRRCQDIRVTRCNSEVGLASRKSC